MRRNRRKQLCRWNADDADGRGSARIKLKRSGANPPHPRHPRHPRSINQYIEMKIASGSELFRSTAKMN
jgi:hypothetical protein